MKRAQTDLAKGKVKSACTDLTDFAKLVKADQAKNHLVLTGPQATQFLATADAVRTTLGC